MKNANLSWLATIILALFGALFPEYADPELLNLTFATLGGIVGIVVLAVNGLKKLLKYGDSSWKHLPKVLAVLVGVIISSLGWWLKLGMFASQTIVWWQAVATGLVAAGAANLWYDLTFGKLILQLIGLSPKREDK